MALSPYPKYKDSKINWVGVIPDTWDIKPVFTQYLLNQRTNDSLPERPVLSLSYGRIIVKPAEKLHGLVPDSFDSYQIVKPQEIVIRPTDLQNDKNSLRIGFSKHEGIITSAYLNLSVKNSLLPGFGYQYLNVWDLTKAIYGFGSGLRQNLEFKHFKRMDVVIPPKDEQLSILKYLSYINNRISKFISTKRKLIKLLEEQKQAIIHQAVTGAIDVKTGKKYLNYNSISDKELSIPSEWLYKPLKHVVSFVNNNLSSNTDENYLFKYIDISTVGTGKLKTNPIEIIFKDAPSRARKIPSKFDTIISTVRTYLKAIYYFDENPENIIVSTGFSILRAKTGTDPNYIALITQSNYFMDEVIRLSTGTSYPAITESKMGTIKIPIPPVATQKVIIDYLAKLSMKYEETISQYNNEISLLVEYKTRLIADVVTGKVDVRKVASTLPEELEVVDELDNSEEEIIEEAPEVDENESN